MWAPGLFATRVEEGLNEYGEAPPPYGGSTGQGKVAEDGGDLEMQIRPSGSRNAECSGSTGPGDGSSQQAHTHGLQDHLVAPPAYEEPPTEGIASSSRNIERRHEGGSASVTEPPPVVLAGHRPA